MYKGIIELESLNDVSVLKEVRIVGQTEEQHPEANTKNWHIYKVEVPDDKIKLITQRISEVIKPDWYSLFWNDSDIYAVFSNKIFQLSREQAVLGDYQEAKEYGIKHGIQEGFIDLQRTINSF